jgi:exopolyphosphatase/guanosine-5'-triphosphate,3'-diphosphate pyrophosphatase
LPKKRHEAWQLIEGRDQRRLVNEMALLLRMAVALDRRPAAMIDRFWVQPQGLGPEGPSGFTVSLVPRASDPGEGPLDLSLEQWSLRSCAPMVMEASGLNLVVEVVSAANDPVPLWTS